MKLTSRTIVVTGGSSGLGLEISRQLIARGNTVLAIGRDLAKLAMARSLAPGLHTFSADIADPEQRLHLRDYVQSTFPSCDMLINNAGIMRSVTLGRNDEGAGAEREIAVNLTAPIHLSSLFVPILRDRADACIVNVSSGLAYAPFPVAPIYSATKAALHSFTQSLRIQLRSSGIRVVELIPPGLDTPMITAEVRSAMAGQRMAPVANVARMAIRRIEAGDTEIAPGASSVLRLMSRLAPGLLMRQMASMYERAAAAT